MKIDKTRGWVSKDLLVAQPGLKDFVRPLSPRVQSHEFLEGSKGVPYVWGGLSNVGVDCSGLTQLYFFSVFDKIIPRNSRDQRSYASEKLFSAVKDNDLVYGVGRLGGSHHVGLFLNSQIWHSYREEG